MNMNRVRRAVSKATGFASHHNVTKAAVVLNLETYRQLGSDSGPNQPVCVRGISCAQPMARHAVPECHVLGRESSVYAWVEESVWDSCGPTPD